MGFPILQCPFFNCIGERFNNVQNIRKKCDCANEHGGAGPTVEAVADFSAAESVLQTSACQSAEGIPQAVRRVGAEAGEVLAENCIATALVHTVEKSIRLEIAGREMVCRRQNQSLLQLPRPAPFIMAAQ